MCSGGSGGIRVPIANQQFLGPFPVWQLEADVIQNEAVQQPQPCCFDPPRLGRGTQLSSKPSFLSLSLSLCSVTTLGCIRIKQLVGNHFFY